MSEIYFDHEKLKVYQKALTYVEWLEENLFKKSFSMNLRDQIERASNSIILNLAEGNGKFSNKDRCRYFDFSLGSVYESAACLDVISRKKILTSEKTSEAKLMLKEIAAMLYGLIKSNSDRVYEPDMKYGESDISS